MISISEALSLCREAVRPLPQVTLGLEAALGRVVAQAPASAVDLPPFPQSGMDGYAVVAADTRGATPQSPVRLRRSGVVAAATQDRWPEIESGHAARIFTGGVVPKGADAVVRQEIVTVDGDDVLLSEPVPEGNNVRAQGEELTVGTPLMEAGNRLTPARLASLAAAGVEEVTVYRAPAVRVIITGDEVKPIGEPLPLGAVNDANGPFLRAWLRDRGITDVRVHYVSDDDVSHREALSECLEDGDLVVTAGGVSVGEKDLVIPVAESLGVERLFWRVRQKPGKPLYMGVGERGVPLLGLPGNPATVVVGANVYLRCLLDGLDGVSATAPCFHQGVAASPIPRDSKRDCWVRGRWETDATGVVRLSPLSGQASHMLSNLAAADALMYVPAGEGDLPADTAVPWLTL
jgi:molybdopterin molybdotransferase